MLHMNSGPRVGVRDVGQATEHQDEEAKPAMSLALPGKSKAPDLQVIKVC